MKPLKRKVCAYTSGRMDYGLLRGLMQEIAASDQLRLQILASGMHLSPEFGKSIDEIFEDGFKPDETVEILLSSDTPIGVCKSMGLAMIGYGEAIQRLQPDIIVVLGDRFETFCTAAAAQVCRVPLGHIHGGETTEGAIDEAFRHSITKMSHLHFASCEEYRKRIIQLGEPPDCVFNVGALGVENIKRTHLMNRQELAESIGFHIEERYFLVTFHPVTLEKDTAGMQFKALLDALEEFPDYKVIITKTNADSEGRVINRMIDLYAERRNGGVIAVTSLGMRRYLSAMKYAEVVIGNSSSGIIEAPTLKVPTVNIGDRQKGRVRTVSVIECEPTERNILQAIKKALSNDFKRSLGAMKNPYEGDNTARRIKDAIGNADLSDVLKKPFHSLPS